MWLIITLTNLIYFASTFLIFSRLCCFIFFFLSNLFFLISSTWTVKERWSQRLVCLMLLTIATIQNGSLRFFFRIFYFFFYRNQSIALYWRQNTFYYWLANYDLFFFFSFFYFSFTMHHILLFRQSPQCRMNSGSKTHLMHIIWWTEFIELFDSKR